MHTLINLGIREELLPPGYTHQAPVPLPSFKQLDQEEFPPLQEMKLRTYILKIIGRQKGKYNGQRTPNICQGASGIHKYRPIQEAQKTLIR